MVAARQEQKRDIHFRLVWQRGDLMQRIKNPRDMVSSFHTSLHVCAAPRACVGLLETKGDDHYLELPNTLDLMCPLRIWDSKGLQELCQIFVPRHHTTSARPPYGHSTLIMHRFLHLQFGSSGTLEKILRRLLHCRVPLVVREQGWLAPQQTICTVGAKNSKQDIPPSVFKGLFREKQNKSKSRQWKKKMAASSQRAVGSRQMGHWNEEPCKDEVRSVQLSYVVQDAVKRWYDDTYRDAQRGDVKQQALLGQMLAEGYGCTRDPKAAEEWMEKARKRGFKMEGVYCQL